MTSNSFPFSRLFGFGPRQPASAETAAPALFRPARADILAVCAAENGLMPRPLFVAGDAVAVVNDRHRPGFLGRWELLDPDYFPFGVAVTGTVVRAQRDSGFVEELIGPDSRNRTILRSNPRTKEEWLATARQVLAERRQDSGLPSLSYWSYKVQMDDPVACPIRYPLCEAFLERAGSPGVRVPAGYSEHHGSGFNAS